MRMLTLFAVLFSLFTALPAPAVLTDADLDKIRLIIHEEIKPLKDDIATIKADIARLDGRITGLDGRITGLDGRITGLEKQISHATNVTYGLIALIVLAIGIPQIIMAWRSSRERVQDKINQELRAEIEMLKNRQIFDR